MNVRTQKALLTLGTVVAIAAGFFLILSKQVADHSRAIHITKVAVGLVAAGYFFYEQRRKELVRPLSVRWKKFIAITLGVVSILLYFNTFKLGYHKWYHRHDQFHYYMGAKYFDELGYDDLYVCSTIAQDELGTVTYEMGGRTRQVNLKAEVRRNERVLRDLGNTNLLIPAKEILDNPERCTKKKDGSQRFSPERWEEFKEDVKFFRIEAGQNYWEGMQKDHGYNPPPIWTLAGKFFSSLAPASVEFMLFLGGLDVVLVLVMFGAIYWAFGWRVFSVAAIFWGCEGAADPYYWTGGAFLRQDWLLYIVLASCFAKKRYFKLAGAAMVYAGLLRIFPGVMVIGWLVIAGAYIYKHKRMRPDHVQALIGGTLAAAILIGVSVAYVGVPAWKSFYEHTIVVHDRTPLTNHMGFRVLVAHNPTTGKDSGRMKYTRDNSMTDPFKLWKEMRNERYNNYKWLAWLIRGGLFIAFVYVVRRVKLLWVAQGLAVIWCIMLAQLTNYYYGFFICAAPLILVRRNLELAIYGYVVLSQVVFLNIHWNDDKYALQTLIGLLLAIAFLCAFWPPRPKRAPPAKLKKAAA